jgi:hypothetical protein
MSDGPHLLSNNKAPRPASAAAEEYMLTALKAMAEAPYDQPIGTWRAVINTALARAEATS